MSTTVPQPLSLVEKPVNRSHSEEQRRGTAGSFGRPVDELNSQPLKPAFLIEVNATLAAAIDVEAALGTILSKLIGREQLSHARIYRLDEAAGELQQIAYGGTSGEARQVLSLKDHTLPTWAVWQGSAVYVPRVEKDPRCLGFSEEERCAYAVPLQTSTSVLGVLEVAANHPDGIRSMVRKLIDEIATQAALALERSVLYKQLQVSEGRFRSIFEQVLFGVVLANLDGRFSTVNPAFGRLLGYECEELQGKHYSEVTHPQDEPVKRAQLQQLVESGSGQVQLEIRYLRKTGEPVWCATNVSLLQDAFGRPTHFLAMVQNVDAYKKGEEQRNRMQQQLFQAQKMEALGALAGGIAHDFNNLLNVMLGFASLARQRLKPGDPLQDSMSMIEQSAQRAAELTRQLLGFARPEIRQDKPVSVNEVLDRMRHIVERTFDRRITVLVREEITPLWVNAESGHLEQALLNMCINARDAMPEGGILTLETEAVSGEGKQLLLPNTEAFGRFANISVQDTGAGIAPDVLPKVFEPFFTTKSPGRGTGLGLSMVYEFAKSHDGFVHAESSLGQGARFTISLPLIQAPPSPACSGGMEAMQLGSGTILVVDDESMVRAFATEGLKGLGYRVLEAENGRQAFQVYEQHRNEIDCVFMDMTMPELSGLEAFRLMRQEDPNVRVVFTSGYSTGEILRNAADASTAEFIGKPYTLEKLSLALRKASAGKAR